MIDLGSGGGLPGLVVAAEWPEVDAGPPGGQRAAGRIPPPGGRAPCPRGSGLGPGGPGGGVGTPTRRTDGLRRCAGPFLRAAGRGGRVCRPPSEGRPAGCWSPSPPGPRVEVDDEGRWPPEELLQVGLEPAEVVDEEFRVPRVAPGGGLPRALPPAQRGSLPRSPCSEAAGLRTGGAAHGRVGTALPGRRAAASALPAGWDTLARSLLRSGRRQDATALQPQWQAQGSARSLTGSGAGPDRGIPPGLGPRAAGDRADPGPPAGVSRPGCRGPVGAPHPPGLASARDGKMFHVERRGEIPSRPCRAGSTWNNLKS